MQRLAIVLISLAVSGSATAGIFPIPVQAVNADAPWAIGGLAAVVAVVAARLIRARRG